MTCIICLREVLLAVDGLLNFEMIILASCFCCLLYFSAVKGRMLFIEKELIVLNRINSELVNLVNIIFVSLKYWLTKYIKSSK
jgi:hypothetical protein